MELLYRLDSGISMNRTSVTVVRTLRRVGLGSLTGIALYLFIVITASAITFGYLSLIIIGTDEQAWFTIGNSPAWFTLGNPNPLTPIEPTYTAARIILSIAIGLIIAIWEIIYILGSEEVNWVLAFSVAMFGILVITLSQVIWSIL